MIAAEIANIEHAMRRWQVERVSISEGLDGATLRFSRCGPSDIGPHRHIQPGDKVRNPAHYRKKNNWWELEGWSLSCCKSEKIL